MKKVKNECPYKDNKPGNTINQIRNILIDNGIFTTELYWLNNINKFYSCRVQLKGTNIGTNGKGLDEEYTLASAYAEFMERLQNQLLFPRLEINPIDQAKYGFRIDPKERRIKLKQTTTISNAFKNAKPFYDDVTLYDFWEEFRTTSSVDNEIVLLPYYNLNDNLIEYLPYSFMSYFYRSNGMCAGNTPEEALVQGLSEIFERYTLNKIYFEEITPPTITKQYLFKNAHREYQLINAIESSGQYKIIVKDCSLGKNIPVIGIVFIDLTNNLCSVKFGSDPDQKIAIERCLTELLQGASLTQINKLEEIRLDPFDININPDNFRTIMTVGKGRFPNSFFGDNSHYAFKEFANKKFKNMQEKLYYSISLVKSLGFNDIFIRDVSIMKFPSYHVIVPGLSEAFKMTENAKTVFSNPISIVKMLKDINNMDKTDLKKLSFNMENFRMAHEQTINFLLTDYFTIPIKNNKEWDKITLEFLLTIIFYKIGNYKKAHRNISIFINLIKERFNNVNLEYYYCVKEFLSLCMQDFKSDNIRNILKGIYGEEVVNAVLDDFSDTSKLFKNIPLPNCWDCQSCQLFGTCQYESLRDLYLIVKKNSNLNPIDQMKLKEIFIDYNYINQGN